MSNMCIINDSLIILL